MCRDLVNEGGWGQIGDAFLARLNSTGALVYSDVIHGAEQRQVLPVKLTVHVNARAGTTLKNTASVAAKTHDVVPSNNSATVYVKVH